MSTTCPSRNHIDEKTRWKANLRDRNSEIMPEQRSEGDSVGSGTYGNVSLNI